jgi:hypothetical protein
MRMNSIELIFLYSEPRALPQSQVPWSNKGVTRSPPLDKNSSMLVEDYTRGNEYTRKSDRETNEQGESI